MVNTDLVHGSFIHSIIGTINHYGLEEQDARFGSKRLKKIKPGDVIIFGDCTSSFDYDFRVIRARDVDELDKYDGRSFKVYDAVEDYEYILSCIKKYAQANKTGRYGYYHPKQCCYHKPKKQKPVVQKVNINVDLCNEEPVFLKRDVCSFKRVDPVRTTEKVTFFCDYVKIGYHQFDIKYDVMGNEFIEDGSRNKYYISEDRYGRRFLVTR